MTAVEPKMHVQYPVRYKTVRVNDQDIFRLVAPDYPGCGQGSMPDYEAFLYSFGDPIGYGLALKHMERVHALVVQNGNAREEGLLEFWDWQRSR